MDYGLTRPVTGSSWHFEPLSREEFRGGVTAQKKTWLVLELEEKLNLLLENYTEYELELFGMALRTSYEDPDPLIMADERQTANRRLLNLVSSGYLYLEQIRKSIPALVGRSSAILAEVEVWVKVERQNFGFRAMEELRRHIQHFGLPIRALTYQGQWVELPGGSSRRKHTVRPKLDLTALEADRDFNRDTLAELQGLGEQLDLKLLVRAYISGVVNVHSRLREAIKTEVAEWDSCVLGLIQRYLQGSGENNENSLRAVARDEQGKYAEVVPLFDFPIARRKQLERRSGSAKSLESVLITNE